MKLTAEQAIKQLQAMDPQSVIEIGGGHVDYVTDDIELVESNGVITIQESSRLVPERYARHDIPESASTEFDTLVIYRSYMANISEAIRLFDTDFTGNVVMDCLSSLGNNSNRFIGMSVTEGVVDMKSVREVQLGRKDPLREFSTALIRKDSAVLTNSILSRIQVSMIERGLTL